jgi:hypothetical protein
MATPASSQRNSDGVRGIAPRTRAVGKCICPRLYVLPQSKANVKRGRAGRNLWQRAGFIAQRLSAKREVAGADVGVQLVLSAATLLEGAEQSAMRFAERRGLEVTGHDGGVDVAVVRRIADRDGQVAEVEFDVLVAGDSLDRKVAGRHANKEHGGTGDFDGDFKVVLGAAEDAEVPVIVRASESDGEVASVVGIAPAEVDRDPIVAVPDDSEFAGAEVQAQIAPGREVYRKRMILKVFDLDFGVREACRYQQGQRRKQDGTPHYHLQAIA